MSDDSQHKPAIRIGVDWKPGLDPVLPEGVGWENEVPVPIVRPYEDLADTEDLLADLEDTGVIFPNWDQACRIVTKALDGHGDHKAAEVLGIIFSRLPGGRRGTELRKALLMGCELSTQDDAKALGVPRQTLFRAIKRLRADILQKTDDGTP